MIGRYLRAFVKALQLTLSGRQLTPTVRYPALQEWAARTVVLVDDALAAADNAGFDATQRSAFRISIDKRAVTLESALQTIRHHAAREYPYLLKDFTPYSLMTLQATNLNDRYVVLRLAEESPLPTPLREQIAHLRDHLDGIPTQQEGQSTS